MEHSLVHLSLIILASLSLGNGFAADPAPPRDSGTAHPPRPAHKEKGAFNEAVTALKQALEGIPPNDRRYQTLFHRILSLYERAGTIQSLEKELLDVSSIQLTEETAFHLTCLYEHLTDTKKWPYWAEKLVEISSGDPHHRKRLARALTVTGQNDKAGKVLDLLLKDSAEPVPTLILDRSRIDLRLGQPEAATRRLRSLLQHYASDTTLRAQILSFTQCHYLDGLTQDLLFEKADAADTVESSIGLEELISFLSERERVDEAVSFLKTRVDLAPAETPAVRFLEGAEHLLALDRPALAITFCRRATSQSPGSRKAFLLLGEALFFPGPTRDPEAALLAFETAWNLSRSIDEQHATDEKLFFFLEQQATSASPAQHDSASQPSPLSVIDSQETKGTHPEEEFPEPRAASSRSIAFAQKLAKHAHPAEPKRLLRAAWWSLQVSDYATTYRLISEIFFSSEADQSAAMPAEFERFLLKLAIASDNRILENRLLRSLIGKDPGSSADYTRRLAEIQLLDGQPDRALPLLEDLVTKDPCDIKTLEILTILLRRNARPTTQPITIEPDADGDSTDRIGDLWKHALAHAEPASKASIARSYAHSLYLEGKQKEAANVFCQLAVREADPNKQQEIFHAQEHLLDLVIFQTDEDLGTQNRLLQSFIDAYRTCETAHPTDPFYPKVLARLFQRKGASKPAFAAMLRAFYLSEGDKKMLPDLREMATAADDTEAAISFQKRLLFSLPAITDSNEGAYQLEQWSTLVTLLENELRLQEADAIRELYEPQFFRMPQQLIAIISDYFNQGNTIAALRGMHQLQELLPWKERLGLATAMTAIRGGHPTTAKELLYRLLNSVPRDNTLPQFLPILDPGEPSLNNLQKITRQLTGRKDFSPETQKALRSFLSELTPYFTAQSTQMDALRVQALHAALSTGKLPEPILIKDPGEQLLVSFAQSDHEAIFEASIKYYLENPSLERFFGSAATCVRAGIPHVFFEWQLSLPSDLETFRSGTGVTKQDAELPKPAPSEELRKNLFLAAFEAIPTIDSEKQSNKAITGLTNLEKHFTVPELWAMARSLADRAAYRDALSIAKPCVDRPTASRYFYAYSLSRYAFFLGDFTTEEHYLRIALHQELYDIPLSERDVFYDAYGRLHKLLENDPPARTALMREVLHRLNHSPPHREITARKAFITLLDGHAEKASQLLKSYYQAIASTGKPGDWGTHDSEPDVKDPWMVIHQKTVTLHSKSEASDPITEASLAFARKIALSSDDDNETGDQERSFLQQNLLSKLFHTRTFAERMFLILEHADGMQKPIRARKLAALLIGQGFQREAAHLYRILLDTEPDNTSYCANFLFTAFSAGCYKLGLDYLKPLNGESQEVIPSGLDRNLLANHHAKFLRASGHIDELTQIAIKETPRAPGAALIGDTSEKIFYLRELGAHQQNEDDWTGALESAHQLIKLQPDNPKNKIALVRALLETNKISEAHRVLQTLLQAPVKPSLFTEGILLFCRIPDQKNPQELRKLLIKSLELPNPAGTIALAEHIEQGGDAISAVTSLQLAARRATNPESRLKLLVEAMTRAQIAEAPASKELNQLLNFFVQSVPQGEAFSLPLRKKLSELNFLQDEIRVEIEKRLLPLVSNSKSTSIAFLAILISENSTLLEKAVKAINEHDHDALETKIEAAHILLGKKQHNLAASIWQSLKERNPVIRRLSCLDLEIAIAKNSEPEMERILSRERRTPFSNSPYQLSLCKALVENNKPDLASEFFAKFYRDMLERHDLLPEFIDLYLSWLLQSDKQEHLKIGEQLLVRHHAYLSNSATLAADLADKKNLSVNELKNWVFRFDGTDGWSQKVLSQTANRPHEEGAIRSN